MTTTKTGTLYETCERLFADYPLAAKVVSTIVRSMVLMLVKDGEPEFFILTHQDDGRPFFHLHRWRDCNPSGNVDVERDATTLPGWAVDAITNCVPLPKDGSFFGWVHRGTVTAVVVIYTRFDAEHPVPGFSLMLLAGSPERQWPPFLGEKFFGPWFWEHFRAGRIVNLAPVIAATQRLVFWVQEADGEFAVCAVRAPIDTADGYTIPAGRYVYYETLRDGKPVPSLETLLSDDSKVDLGPRFKAE